jgi:hypothetical protein
MAAGNQFGGPYSLRRSPEIHEPYLPEIRRLEQFIAEHSKRAEQAITASYQERHEGNQEMTEDNRRRTG